MSNLILSPRENANKSRAKAKKVSKPNYFIWFVLTGFLIEQLLEFCLGIA